MSRRHGTAAAALALIALIASTATPAAAAVPLSAVARGLDVPLDISEASQREWLSTPLYPFDDGGGFQLRWHADHLSVYVEADDDDPQENDGVEFIIDGARYMAWTDGIGDPEFVLEMSVGGYTMVARLPLGQRGAAGQTHTLDVRVIDDDQVTSAWNPAGSFGTVTLLNASPPQPRATSTTHGSVSTLIGRQSDRIIYTLRVSTTNGSEPTGPIAVYDGTERILITTLGTGSHGLVKFSFRFTRGVHLLQARYAGSGYVGPSRSTWIPLVVR